MRGSLGPSLGKNDAAVTVIRLKPEMGFWCCFQDKAEQSRVLKRRASAKRIVFVVKLTWFR